MTIITTLIITFLPVAVSFITEFFKKLPKFESLSYNRRPIIRLLAATISVIAVLITSWTTDTFNVNVVSSVLEALLLAFITWIGSLGTYSAFLEKK